MGTTNTNDPVEIARQVTREALSPHFKGPKRVERLEKATTDVINSIVHLVKTAPTTQKGRLGATVMTPTASERNPHTGKHSVPPRQL